MKRICLISCVSKKLKAPSEAKNLYVSPWFKKASLIASKYFDECYILSAKYGLLNPEEIITPYEKTLLKMTRIERLKWANKVIKQINNQIEKQSEIIIFAGEKYREFLNEYLSDLGYRIIIPLQGLSIGKQMNWFDRLETPPHRNKHLDRFYSILKDLYITEAYVNDLSNTNGSMKWPNKGVYYFFEKDENRTLYPDQGRIIRVGTHGVSKGSKSKFWHRLKAHLGTNSGGGNHRSSIFRLHVGSSLKNKYNYKNYEYWGIGQNASKEIKSKELELEKQVSKYIKNLSICWLNINDKSDRYSDRAYIERNSIALLCNSKGTIDFPSSKWLGNFSSKETIRRSGLWNLNYVYENYDPRFLEVLEYYVNVTLGKEKETIYSVAPKDWYLNQKKNQQLTLGGIND